MSSDIFEARRQSLEAEFFAERNEKLRQKLKALFEQQTSRESLKAASGITDERVIDTLISLNVTLQTLAAFSLFPLVEVAWADGSLDDRERAALLAAAAKDGLVPGTPGRTVLEEWLQHPPRAEGRQAWRAYAAELSRQLNAAERHKVRDELVRRTRAVAEASGGILGLGNRTSAKEEAVLTALAEAFPD